VVEGIIGLHPVVSRELLPISLPGEDRRLSLPRPSIGLCPGTSWGLTAPDSPHPPYLQTLAALYKAENW